MASALHSRTMQLETLGACVLDITPPTFAGITGLVQNADGSLTASWGAATDANSPVRFVVYLQKTTATGLFSTANALPLNTYQTSLTFDRDVAGLPLQVGVTYFVGVRAVDPSGNFETNVVSLSVAATGPTAPAIYQYIQNLLGRGVSIMDMEIQAVETDMSIQAADFDMEMQSAEEDI